LRGPLRLAEAIALLPQVKRKLPAAKLPMENPRALLSMLGAAAFVRVLRESDVRPVARELLSAVASITPAVLALRSGELAAYHGAEHISIGSYEHGKRTTREHERCGGHLIGPLLATTAVANLLAGRAEPGGSSGRDDRSCRRRYRDLRLDDAAPLAPVGAGAREAGARAPAPLLDRRADCGAARGGRGGARSVPRARACRRRVSRVGSA